MCTFPNIWNILTLYKLVIGFVYESHPGIDEGTMTDLYMHGPQDGLPLYYTFVNVNVFDQIYNALEHDIRISFVIDFAQIPGVLRDCHSVCRDISNASFFADYRLVSREGGEIDCHKAVLTGICDYNVQHYLLMLLNINKHLMYCRTLN